MKLISRPIEQANLVLGCEGLSRTDERRFALGVLNAALGGGMSSRLFQEVREKRGLAYSVYSFASQHADTGLWGIYVGCLPSKADEVLSICSAEVAKVVESGLTDAELDRGKGQVRGGIVLGLEDPSSRMTRLGKSELVYPGLEPVDDVLAAIDAVTHDDIRAIAAEVLSGPRSWRWWARSTSRTPSAASVVGERRSTRSGARYRDSGPRSVSSSIRGRAAARCPRSARRQRAMPRTASSTPGMNEARSSES